MSNRQHFSNENRSSDDEEQDPINNGYIYVVVILLIPIQQPTRLAEPATDQRTINPQTMTNREIDDLIQHQPQHLQAIIPAACWRDLILFYFFIYYCPLLLPLALIVYWMMTYNNQPAVILPEPQPRRPDLPFDYAFDLDRDAEAENRTASPTPDIEIFPTVEIPEPYGVQTAFINNNNGRINPIIRIETTVRTTTNVNQEVNFADNIQQQAPTLPTTENRLAPVQNNDQTNQPVLTPLRRETIEIENIAPPTEGNIQALLHVTGSTGPTVPQPKDSPPPNGTFRDESTP